MNILQRAQKKLEDYPHIKIETAKSDKWESITIQPVSDKGFPVSIFLYRDGEFQVCGELWRYERFDLKDEDEAIEKFFLSLSSKARLRVTSRGGVAYSGTLELANNGKWIQEGGVTDVPTFCSCFWKKKVETLYQNTYI